MNPAEATNTPLVTTMRVIPVAGHDCMLLNLSGAHGPFFTRNVVLLTDSAGRTGAGEVPGGEKIRQTLEEALELVIGQRIGNYQAVLNSVQERFGARDASGRGVQTNLLKLLEETEVPIRSQTDLQSQLQAAMEFQKRGGKVKKETINTRHILFIVSGAFDKLPEIVSVEALESFSPLEMT